MVHKGGCLHGRKGDTPKGGCKTGKKKGGKPMDTKFKKEIAKKMMHSGATQDEYAKV